MIVGLKGEIEGIAANHLRLDVNGVVYGLQVSLLSAMDLQVGQRVAFLISEVIREDAHLLFGFLDALEQEIFERLIKINGVGPKVALAILSSFRPQDFASLIQNKDIHALQKVPGIGAKGASKIMVDLAGFFDFSSSKQGDPRAQEVQMALEGLGFKKNEIQAVLQKIPHQETAKMLKDALKLLQ